jgi:hypothetical protein
MTTAALSTPPGPSRDRPAATEEDTACCYAVQDKVLVTGPGQEPWEVYTVKSDARHPRQGRSLRLLRPCRRPDPDSRQPAVRLLLILPGTISLALSKGTPQKGI